MNPALVTFITRLLHQNFVVFLSMSSVSSSLSASFFWQDRKRIADGTKKNNYGGKNVSHLLLQHINFTDHYVLFQMTIFI